MSRGLNISLIFLKLKNLFGFLACVRDDRSHLLSGDGGASRSRVFAPHHAARPSFGHAGAIFKPTRISAQVWRIST